MATRVRTPSGATRSRTSVGGGFPWKTASAPVTRSVKPVPTKMVKIPTRGKVAPWQR